MTVVSRLQHFCYCRSVFALCFFFRVRTGNSCTRRV